MDVKWKCLLVFLLFGAISWAQERSPGRGFDFYYGSWTVENQRQQDDGSWVAFTARVEARETLNGWGNVDFFEAVIDGEAYAGMSVRQYDRATGTWQVRWYDSDDPAAQPIPSVGRFENGEGKFYKTIETENGREVQVRFHWSDITVDSFHWEAAWSVDGNEWQPVWIMDFMRNTTLEK